MHIIMPVIQSNLALFYVGLPMYTGIYDKHVVLNVCCKEGLLIYQCYQLTFFQGGTSITFASLGWNLCFRTEHIISEKHPVQ